MIAPALASALFLAALMPSLAYAQGTSSTRESPSVGVSLNFMSPRNEFRQNVGGGINGHRGAIGFDLIAPLTYTGWLSMRIDYMFGSYHKGGYGCRCAFNSITIGPEVLVPRGPMRPYATGAWGHLHFESFTDASGTKADTGAGQWIYGGGVRVPLTSASRWSLDVGVRRHHGGDITYVLEAGGQINPDRPVSVDSARTSTPFVMYSVGFQYQFK